MTWLAASLGIAIGFALCWFTKDYVLLMVTSTETFASNLEAKAKALRAAL